MNIKEACTILGVQEGCSEKEFKDAFRNKSKEMHPDKNKSETAEEDYKKVTEAFQVLKSEGTKSKPQNPFGFSNDFNDVMESFFYNYHAYHGHVRPEPAVSVKINISFEESILGCEKKIKFNRKILCSECNGKSGMGDICSSCNGMGKKRVQQGFTILVMGCKECNQTGRVKNDSVKCEKCSNSGLVLEEKEESIYIMAGITHKFVLNRNGIGNYNLYSKKFDHIIITVYVQESKDFTRNRSDVITKTTITLLEALKGCIKSIPTVKGPKDLKIQPGIKNGDIISVKGFGVPPYGCQQIVVLVDYPENTEKIIKFLEGE